MKNNTVRKTLTSYYCANSYSFVASTLAKTMSSYSNSVATATNSGARDLQWVHHGAVIFNDSGEIALLQYDDVFVEWSKAEKSSKSSSTSST
ncbi:hypothetical protein TanjilG_32730 [Lupinus angustifolius]|uniref:Uncharacterized protein n=1 Tax=Lupinus angustifolius TaxID=3871 RepID=A0A4P1RFB3_LUPAN|nr:hypothetical protein TanjilG_32730 [Lupinus angustifolius]